MNDCSVPLPTRENVGVRKAEPAVPTYADHSMKGSALLRNALDKRDSTAGRRSVVGNLHDVARQHSSVSANQPLLSSLFDISRQQPPRASETNSKDDGRVVLVKREGAGQELEGQVLPLLRGSLLPPPAGTAPTDDPGRAGSPQTVRLTPPSRWSARTGRPPPEGV